MSLVSLHRSQRGVVVAGCRRFGDVRSPCSIVWIHHGEAGLLDQTPGRTRCCKSHVDHPLRSSNGVYCVGSGSGLRDFPGNFPRAKKS